jgi:stearoyl-CoA desaturase (delta-9 desaturase)
MDLMLSTADSSPAAGTPRASVGRRFLWWLTNDPRHQSDLAPEHRDRLDWLRIVPFVSLHLGCLLVFEVGVSKTALVVAAGLYVARMFFVTAFYHRYFSHRAFRAGRVTQLVMAILGATAGQRGPLWWAAHHREHHLTADTAADPHSPEHRGVFFSHTLWFLTRGNFQLHRHRVKDWLEYRELRLLEKLDWVPFLLLAAGCYGAGRALEVAYPHLNTNGPQMLVWGFFVSTVVLYHATYSINSIAHRLGTRRFPTRDQSRNNFWLAVLTLGEGWHNNHHHYPASARQGFRWWELDISYLVLKVLASIGLIADLRPVPRGVLNAAKARRADTP